MYYKCSNTLKTKTKELSTENTIYSNFSIFGYKGPKNKLRIARYGDEPCW